MTTFESVLRELSAHGSDLELLGVADLGETAGAAFVVWPDGRKSVLTLMSVPLDRAFQTAELMLLARERGLPVARFEVVRKIETGGVAVVQERLRGQHPSVVDPGVVDTIVAANEGFADLLSGHQDVPTSRLNLGRDGSSAWRTPLISHSDRSRRLFRRIEEVALPLVDLGNDLVHPDLTVSNVLFDQDWAVTGIIDWNDGALRGDRQYALVKLLFDLTWEAAAPNGGRHHVQPAALAHLTELVHQALDPDRLRAFWAHWTVTMLYWTIRSGDVAAVDLHLELGEQVLL